jgi:hypothetical protein
MSRRHGRTAQRRRHRIPASFQANASGDIVPIPCGGSIGDFVWNDLNRNGVQEPAEPGWNGSRFACEIRPTRSSRTP